MLASLSIRNIVLIEALDLSFSRGLTVITGETGAGKSIILDALGLALGNRADARLVRNGEKQGAVSAEFIVTDPSLDSLLREQGIAQEEILTVRRTLYHDGKSKAFVNDEPVSVANITNIAACLVEVHGQHDQREHRSLRRMVSGEW